MTRKSAAQAAKTLKASVSPTSRTSQPTSRTFFDEMAGALQDHDCKRLEIIGFRGCAKSTMASLALVLYATRAYP